MTWPRIDGIAQIHIGESTRAHVANGRKARQQRVSGIHNTVDGFLGVGVGQFLVRVELRVHRDVRMHIDQPWQHRQRAQIDNGIAAPWQALEAVAEMAVIVSPLTTTVCASSSLPLCTSSRWPARTSDAAGRQPEPERSATEAGRLR